MLTSSKVLRESTFSFDKKLSFARSLYLVLDRFDNSSMRSQSVEGQDTTGTSLSSSTSLPSESSSKSLFKKLSTLPRLRCGGSFENDFVCHDGRFLFFSFSSCLFPGESVMILQPAYHTVHFLLFFCMKYFLFKKNLHGSSCYICKGSIVD